LFGGDFNGEADCRGSVNPGHETVGKPVSLKHVYEIAKIKQNVSPVRRPLPSTSLKQDMPRSRLIGTREG
jgi:hypothetical protein